jgi:hypothetical protein
MLQNMQNLGARFYALASPLLSSASEKPCNALQTHWANKFCPFSDEAYPAGGGEWQRWLVY